MKVSCMKRNGNSSRRRGVVLLIVLALLVLFAVTAMAFVLLTAHHRKAAEALHKIGRQTYSAEDDNDQALMQLLVGDSPSRSVIGAHSLLGDRYGDNSIEGTIKATTASAQTFEFDPLILDKVTNAYRSSDVVEMAKYTGCVMTMIDGPAAGRSTRIVSLKSTGTPVYTAIKFDGIAPNIDNRFVINGRDFAGFGSGFDPSKVTTSTTWNDRLNASNRPVALLPNTLWEPDHADAMLNEDYDAVDFQNMFMAMQLADGTTPIPSFHRPSLIKYWMNKASVTPTGPGTPPTYCKADWNTFVTNNPDLAKSICLRSLDPDFTSAVNPSFDPLDPDTWDVDCDGDGVPDAIWVDLGFPVRTTPDGRKYKPLFAILCTDLDGRLNVNAHGTIPQATGDSSVASAASPLGSASNQAQPSIRRYQLYADGQLTSNALPRGMGTGPAELDLFNLFGSANATQYQSLLLGDTSLGLYGRYGFDGVPGIVSTTSADSSGELFWMNRMFGLGLDYMDAANPNFNYATNILPYYGSPVDYSGTMSVGLDIMGNPVYRVLDTQGLAPALKWQAAFYNNPYEINLNSPNAGDQVYTPAELEALLRPYDRDSDTLAPRLRELAPTLDDPAKRRLVTTDSWDAPIASLSDMAAYLVTSGMVATEDDAYQFIAKMLPKDIQAGLQLDLNQPLEDITDSFHRRPVEIGSAPDGTSYPVDGISKIDFARNLYILLMAVTDPDWTPEYSDAPSYSGPLQRARALAQFAVNIVDSRDPDSIMTCFYYDPDLTDLSWDIITDPMDANYLAPVFGCERPDLLISETFATHDRATEDSRDELDPTSYYSPCFERANDGTITYPDADFDQDTLPVGSLFVELYNPRTEDEKSGGVNLSELNGNGEPIWRLALTGKSPTDRFLDPDSPDPTKRPIIDQTVYFTNLSYLDQDGDGRIDISDLDLDGSGSIEPAEEVFISPTEEPYYTNFGTAGFNMVVPSTGYAVVGPGNPAIDNPNSADILGDEDDGVSITYFGRLKAATNDWSATRRIELDAAMGRVDVYTDSTNFTPTNTKPIIINMPNRLSVSEPYGGYARDLNAAGTDIQRDPSGIAAQKTPFQIAPPTLPLDVPLDKGNSDLNTFGTHLQYRTIYLQRLADPTKDFDSILNPYLTIDLAQVDLTVFNGTQDPTETSYTNAGLGPSLEEHQLDDKSGNGAVASYEEDAYYCYARERGETIPETTSGEFYNLFMAEFPEDGTPPDEEGTETPADPHIFDKPWQLTLGSLNEPYGIAGTPTGINNLLDSLGITAPADRAELEYYAGSPGKPFAPLSWLNRPFVGKMELMQVPSLKSSWLLWPVFDPTAPDPLTCKDVISGYTPEVTAAGSQPYANQEPHFPYTMNFLFSDDTSTTPLRLYRLLEMVGVRSPFAGTELQTDPAATGGNIDPYYYTLSKYREPGKVNLNTIFDETVWNCMTDGVRDRGPDWKFLEISRSGYADNIDASGNFVLSNTVAGSPTAFANPFRGPLGRNLVPVSGLAGTAEANTTLLRAPGVDDTSQTDPLFGSTYGLATNPVASGDVAPMLRYGDMSRLANMATTRSNAFAVWITVGYFEVTNTGAVDQGHPDGYYLDAELGTDTGDINRHRSFYIIDRSIPVGFLRGEDLNAEKAIRLRRFIE